MRRTVFTVALITLLTGMALAADPTADLKSADQAWSKAAETKNLDQFMTFIADDAYACGPDGKWLHGKAALRDAWGKMFADPTLKLSWSVDTAGASKDGHFGYTRGTFQGTMGGKPMGGSYTTVWEKGKDGKWRVTVDIASSAQ